MAFIFSSSHLPETLVRRPDDIEEEDEENMPAPPRSGMVRGFSHLPPARSLPDPSGPISTRPATPVGRVRPPVAPEADDDNDAPPPPQTPALTNQKTANHGIGPESLSKIFRDFSKISYDKEKLRLLIHEMTHVWQNQNGKNVLLRRVLNPFARYHYDIKDDKSFEDYTIEQQAMILEDYMRSLDGETMVKHPGERARIIYPPAVYEALLPWKQKLPNNPPQSGDAGKNSQR